MRRDRPIHRFSLSENMVLNLAKTLFSLIFPLITFPYISRVLGVAALGKYNVSVSVISYFSLIAGLGVSSYAIREGSQYRDEPAKMEVFADQVFSVNLLATIFSYLLLILFLFVSVRFQPYRNLICILGTEIIFATLGAEWLCTIYEDFLYITIRSLIFQFAYAIAIFAFVKTPDDVVVYTVISAAVVSIPNLINFFYIRKRYVRLRFTAHCDFRKHIKPILILFLSAVTISLYVNSDITILGLLKSDYDVGLYSVAVKIYNIEKSLIAAAVTVLLPSFSAMIKRSNPQVNKIFSRTLVCSLSFMLPCVTGIFMLSADIITMFAGMEYAAADSMLRVLNIAAFFSYFAYLYTYAVVIPFNLEKYAFYASLTSAAANIVLNLLLIPRFGTIVAAYTTAFSELIQAVIAIYVTRKLIRLTDVKHDALAAIAGSILIVFICSFARILVHNQVVFLIVSILASVVSYALIQYFMKTEIMTVMISHLKRGTGHA